MNIIHQEGKSMENKEQEKKAPVTEELSQDQMEKTAGGGFFDSIGCFFNGHGMKKLIRTKIYKGDVYEKYRCQDCGGFVYRKNHQECSEKDFDSIPYV